MSGLFVLMVTDKTMFLIFKVHGAANIYEINVYELHLIYIILEYYDKGFQNVKVSFLLLLFYQGNNTLLLGPRTGHDLNIL